MQMKTTKSTLKSISSLLWRSIFYSIWRDKQMNDLQCSYVQGDHHLEINWNSLLRSTEVHIWVKFVECFQELFEQCDRISGLFVCSSIPLLTLQGCRAMLYEKKDHTKQWLRCVWLIRIPLIQNLSGIKISHPLLEYSKQFSLAYIVQIPLELMESVKTFSS